ncbi:MAG: diacylglycerol O-acyltransferase [Pseudomonadales bacterium]|jgi:diacylglycerol O-acyltransferase
MKQLGVLDSAFINLEQPNTPQHIGGLGIYDPSTAPDGFVRFKQVISSFERRLATMPLFRTRLVEVPGGLDKPYWVRDENFDVEFHLRHIALPHPGDWRQLCIQAARLHARPLDMTRPLWEVYIIEGLDNISNIPQGSFAVYTKIHHSMVDGAGSQGFMAALHDLEPVPAQQFKALNTDEQGISDREPAVGELLTRAVINSAKDAVSLTKSAVNLTGDLVKMGLALVRDEMPVPEMYAPKTRLNKPVGPHRVFESATFKLLDFKALKNATATTINDVALSVIGGAMRKYLEHYNELPDESLTASFPLNMRSRRSQSKDNNQVGSVFASLHTNIADPAERLQAIHISTQAAKQFGEKSPLVDTLKLAGIFSPLVTKAAVRLWSESEISSALPTNISTVISNVPGPNFDLYCAGARLVSNHGLGLLTPGVGIFQMVYSSSNIFTISVLADRDIIPDPEFYRQCIEESFAEHKAAILGKTMNKTVVKGSAKLKPKAKPKAKNSVPADKVSAKKKTSVRKVVRENTSLKKKKGPPTKVVDKKVQ